MAPVKRLKAQKLARGSAGGLTFRAAQTGVLVSGLPSVVASTVGSSRLVGRLGVFFNSLSCSGFNVFFRPRLTVIRLMNSPKRISWFLTFGTAVVIPPFSFLCFCFFFNRTHWPSNMGG